MTKTRNTDGNTPASKKSNNPFTIPISNGERIWIVQSLVVQKEEADEISIVGDMSEKLAAIFRMFDGKIFISGNLKPSAIKKGG